MTKAERLDKVLSNLGYGSRSEIKKDISLGKILVNGIVSKDPAKKVFLTDSIQYGDEILKRKEHYYFQMNKAPDCITATEDKREKTVMDYLIGRHKKMNLFPVGRLDKETEGLLIFTTDGKFAHLYTSPKHLIDKEYYVEVEGILEQSDIDAFESGVTLDDGYKTLPGRLILLEQKDSISTTQDSISIREEDVGNSTSESTKLSYAKVIIREGKNRQIRRMFQSLGKSVLYLRREKMGSIVLDPNLKVGEYRELSEREIQSFFH
ncbi:MAG: rRNA pseudouridine synthase [Leptospira sp.]|nr:rRNA pseudouridine synthase [Leptospira sp.]NCS94692.1 rRNA pseudouridine synthase [Leptospira sp.]